MGLNWNGKRIAGFSIIFTAWALYIAVRWNLEHVPRPILVVFLFVMLIGAVFATWGRVEQRRLKLSTND
jgi:hypothetical protein